MRTRLASIGVALTVFAAVAAHAQPAPDSSLMFDPGALKAEPSRPAATTPAAPSQTKRNTTGTTRRSETASQPLLLDPVDDGAGSRRRVRMQTPKPATQPDPGFGRVPFEKGSFGLETDTQLKASQFPDGRNVLDKAIKNANSPSYFGLSVTVPTDSKTFSPFLPRAD